MERPSVNPSGSSAKVIVQQCSAARVKQKVAIGDNVEYNEINEGIVVYVCFLKACTKEVLSKIVHTVLYSRFLKGKKDERVSILELHGDILIVPQSTLGGIRKKRHITYHYNINKDEGCELYNEFVQMCRREVEANDSELSCRVKCGHYNNKCENMTVESGVVGLMTHIVEF